MLSGGAGTDPVILSAAEVGDGEAAGRWLRDAIAELQSAPSGSSSLAFKHEEAARNAASPSMVRRSRPARATLQSTASASAQTGARRP